MPIATGLPSLKASSGLWQVAQLIVPSALSRVSKNKLFPTATRSGGSAVLLSRGGRPSLFGSSFAATPQHIDASESQVIIVNVVRVLVGT
jgi:hypothetical protein